MQQAKDALARTNEDLEARVAERTTELAREARRREDAQAMLAQTNQELEARVAARTDELAQEMRRREQAQTSLIQAQKMEAIGQLTAGIAHDFNNLLAVIRGSLGFVSDAAKRGVTAEPELIEAALRATRRGRDLVQRLLAFARQAPLRAEPIVVDQLVLDTLRLLQRTLGADIEIVTNLDAKGATVLVDRNQLANVLLNLALNARDAMPGGGQLTITTACVPSRTEGAERCTRSPTGEDVCIKFADTGMGMTDDVRNRVFEPFFTTKQLGSGLGLSMVHGFIQQSDGLIEINSKLGEGTTFTIRLPRIEAPGRPEEDAGVAGLEVAGRRERAVLLVEDDPDVRVVMAAQLKQLGYQVHAVATGFEAVNWIESPATIDITLTDIVLPGGVDGVTLVKEAMRRRPTMGVLCMSGYSPAQHHRKWLMVQNIELLEKPFSTARLAQALESVLPE
jgi:signal transduction histidine kinase